MSSEVESASRETENATPHKTRSGWQPERAREIIREWQDTPGACLPLLLALQAEFGYVPEEAIPLVADALLLSRAEVIGVRDFYHDLRTQPGGRHTLRVCRAESCQSMGCEALVEHLQARLGTRMGETTPDGALNLETAYCLGNCALSPAMLLDTDIYGRVTAARADAILDSLEGPR